MAAGFLKLKASFRLDLLGVLSFCALTQSCTLELIGGATGPGAVNNGADSGTPPASAVTISYPRDDDRKISALRQNAFPIEGSCTEEGETVYLTGAADDSSTCTGGLFSFSVDFSAIADSSTVEVAVHQDGGEPASINLIKDTDYCENPANSTNTPFASSGSSAGTPADPHLICTHTQLDQVRTSLAASYRLRNDIDLQSFPSFTPLGGFSPGEFQGNDFVIFNLTNTSGSNDQGLFQTVAGTVSDLHLEDVNMSVSWSSGAMAGVLFSGSITGSSVFNVTITSTGNNNGGLVGRMDDGLIDDVQAEVYITQTGGGVDNGGLVGFQQAGTGSTINNVTVYGKILGNGSSNGGIVGSVLGTLSNCHSYVDEMVGVEDLGGVTAYLGWGGTQGVLNNCTFYGGSFTGSRHLAGVVAIAANSDIDDIFVEGDVTINASVTGDGFLGGAIGQAWAATTVDHVEVGGDVTISAQNSGYVGGLIGHNDSVANNLVLEGLVTLVGQYRVGGLVGNSGAGGIMTDLLLTSTGSSQISGEQFIGGLIGWSSDDVTQAHAEGTGTVSIVDLPAAGTTARAGGAIGSVEGGTVLYSSSQFNVLINAGAAVVSDFGGFAGYIESAASVQESFALGNVSVNATPSAVSAGGFVGDLRGSVNDCYSHGNIEGSDELGGFVGWQGDAGAGIVRSYSLGLVTLTGAGTRDGGFLGHRNAGSAPTDSFWNTDVSGYLTSNGGGEIGLSDDQMQDELNFTNFNFSGVWKMDPTLSPYPVLDWQ